MSKFSRLFSIFDQPSFTADRRYSVRTDQDPARSQDGTHHIPDNIPVQRLLQASHLGHASSSRLSSAARDKRHNVWTLQRRWLVFLVAFFEI